MSTLPADDEPLYKNSDFRCLWTGLALSDIGSSASQLAYPLLVLALTSSPVYAGIVGAVSIGSRLLFALPAGAFVDRWDRRRVMLISDAVRAIAFAGLSLCIVLDAANISLVLGLAILDGGGKAVSMPAEAAAIRQLVPARHLKTASARMEARVYAAGLIGPALGGSLFGIARFLPFLLGSLSYIASFITVSLIRRPLQEIGSRNGESVARSILSGLRFVVKEPFLRATLVVAPLINLGLTGVAFATVLVLHSRDAPPFAVGLSQAALLAGGLTGALAAPLIQRRLRGRALLLSFSWSIGILVALAAILPGTYSFVIPLCLTFAFAPAANAQLFAYQVAVTPDNLQGRVQSALGLLSGSIEPAAPLLIGVVISYAADGWVFALFSAVLLVAAVAATATRGFRNVESEM